MLTGFAEAVGKARRLRKNISLPEVLLWRELRKRRGALKFRRQHPAGPYILDFACVQSRLAIEVDGEIHAGRTAQMHDEARDEWLANQGYLTVRIRAQDVLDNLEGVVSSILSRCGVEQPLHRASHGPPPRTGEEL